MITKGCSLIWLSMTFEEYFASLTLPFAGKG